MNRNRPLSPEEHAEGIAIARALADVVRKGEWEPLAARARRLFGTTDEDEEAADLREVLDLLDGPNANDELAKIVVRRILARRLK